VDQDQRNALLDILICRVSFKELKYLVFTILEPGDFDRLSGNTHDEKCISFIEELHRKDKEDKLLEVIADRRPDIDLSPFNIVPDPPLEIEEPQPTKFLPFANREEEWKKIVLYPGGQYYLFDAPAGYGKTALLKKLYEEFIDRGWFCAYVVSKEESEDSLTLSNIFERLVQQLEIRPKIYSDDPRRTSLEISKAIVEKRENEPGVALLFDIDHAPQDDFMPVLKIIVETIIPSIWEGLMRNSDFFRLTPKNYRVAVAGRYIATRVKEFNFTYNFDATQLKPLDYRVAQDICTPYVGNRLLDQAERDDFAAHLLFHSSGHPRCMARILQEFEQCAYPPSDFFEFHREKIEKTVSQEISWVKQSIVPSLQEAFENLCIYRRFDYALLQQLLEVPNLIWPGLAEDKYDLARKLKQTYLVDWTGENYQHLSDDITRRLLLLHRIDNDPDRFIYDCEQAKQFCTERLQDSSECRPFWALEVLAEYFQAHIMQIDELQKRRNLRQDFFETELPHVLQLLIKGQHPRVQYEPLKLILAQDWELQFIVNYYLRDDNYNKEPYKEMSQRIDQFFARAFGT
jgi:hypothetical protein